MTFPGVARLRRRKLIRNVIVLAVLIVLLIVSALLWPRRQQGPLTVPTTDAAPAAEGVVRGVLSAEREGDRVCYRLGGTTQDALLILPPGWSASARLGLLDPSGSVVAAPGDTVLVAGDPGAISAVDGCSGTGRVWTVSSLSARA